MKTFNSSLILIGLAALILIWTVGTNHWNLGNSMVIIISIAILLSLSFVYFMFIEMNRLIEANSITEALIINLKDSEVNNNELIVSVESLEKIECYKALSQSLLDWSKKEILERRDKELEDDTEEKYKEIMKKYQKSLDIIESWNNKNKKFYGWGIFN